MADAQSKTRASLGLTLGILALASCGDDEPSPATCADFAGLTEVPDVPLTFSTEHLDIHVDAGQRMCAGTPLEYERFYQYVATELALDLPERVPVYVMSPYDYCPSFSPGCRTRDGVVFALPGPIMHELVHAATCEWRYSSANAWSEGVAVSFEPTPLSAKSDSHEFMTIASDEEFFAHYQAAGHFARWLLEERGPEAFRELFIHSPVSGGDAVFDIIADVYGDDAESLFADYEASAPNMWVPHRQCANVPVLEANAGIWQLDTTFDCDAPSTFGPYERRESITNSDAQTNMMYQSVLIEIDAADSYRFTREATSTGIYVERCLDQTGLTEVQAESLWLREPLVPTLQGTSDIDLTPGTYRVDILREHAPPHPVTLRIEPTPG